MTSLTSFCDTPRPSSSYTKDANWTLGQWSGPGSADSSQENAIFFEKAGKETDEVLENFNRVMIELSSHTNQEQMKPLQTRMKTSWTDATKEEQKMYTEKATEACQVICNVISPSAGQNLFQAVQERKRDCNLDFLTTAYRNTTSKKIKTQILSLYAYEYPASKLIEMHSSFEKLSEKDK